MSYHIRIEGSLKLDPPANNVVRDRINSTSPAWQVTQDGTLLYIPSDREFNTRDPIESLTRIVQEHLDARNFMVSGKVVWVGEDGTSGEVIVESGEIRVEEAESNELSENEIRDLVTKLKQGTEKEKSHAVEILTYFQAKTPEVLVALGSALADDSRDIRIKAAESLSALGDRAYPVLPQLRNALKDSEPWVMAAAAEAIGSIGAKAIVALKDLKELSNHPSYGPAGRAREAIAKIMAS